MRVATFFVCVCAALDVVHAAPAAARTETALASTHYSRSAHVQDWTCIDVWHWLAEEGLNDLAPSACQNGLSGKMLYALKGGSIP